MIVSGAAIYSSYENVEFKATLLNIRNLLPKLARIAQDLRYYILSSYSTLGKVAELTLRDQMRYADLVAQSAIYSAYCAWIHHCQAGLSSKDFNLHLMRKSFPFETIFDVNAVFPDFLDHPRVLSFFDQVVHEFQSTDYHTLLDRTESVITTSYSTFLQYYDPKIAKASGVMYTPSEIVRFILQGVDDILTTHLQTSAGVMASVIEKPGSKRFPIKWIDPAAGTMAFLEELLRFSKEKWEISVPTQEKPTKTKIETFSTWVRECRLKRFFAFEILQAPYILGHTRIVSSLNALGVDVQENNTPLNFFLQNSLKIPVESKHFAGMNSVPDSFYIILGNPPYNLSSQNISPWITDQIQTYKQGLQEKNKKILSDDYVKFIRFAQWKVAQAGHGIIAFITNNRYLEGQMFSVMRKSLRKTFDHIYIVNLHGDMRKKESGNPFNIRVGVCIAFMVRLDNSSKKNAAIHYMDVPHFTREGKFAVLSQGFRQDSFTLLPETSKNYFVEIDTTHMQRYESFIPINQLFVSSPTSGIMAGRDRLLMDTDKSNVEQNLQWFFSENTTELNRLKIKFHDTKSWKKSKVFARTTFEHSRALIRPIQYRGFDFRYLAYDTHIVEGHRRGYIDQITHNNPAITITKSSRKPQFCTAFIANRLIEKCFMSVTDTAYAFLLNKGGKSNIKIPSLPYEATPEQVFYYTYAILFARTYRLRYDEYLRKSFPGIPFPETLNKFTQLAILGEDLAKLHLLNVEIDPRLEIPDIPAEAWYVNDFWYSPEDCCLYFDRQSKKKDLRLTIPYIKGITPEIWNFSIGTIPQLSQFLKSRRFSKTRKWNSLQRSLNHEELVYFLKMCSAIGQSLGLQEEIDVIYCQIDTLPTDM